MLDDLFCFHRNEKSYVQEHIMKNLISYVPELPSIIRNSISEIQVLIFKSVTKSLIK